MGWASFHREFDHLKEAHNEVDSSKEGPIVESVELLLQAQLSIVTGTRRRRFFTILVVDDANLSSQIRFIYHPPTHPNLINLRVSPCFDSGNFFGAVRTVPMEDDFSFSDNSPVPPSFDRVVRFSLSL